ncbi:putative HET-domain-containing protein [Seiridium cardinale]|uniref:HET-domain-containing protein n=1 Tax=Seiridium cardinale TaxID=138064 RepID=A0ABR2XLY9_9PEZI
MTTPLDDYHSCSLCSEVVLSLDNASFRGEFKPVAGPVNEMLIFSNLTLSDIRRGASTCFFFKWLDTQWLEFRPTIYESLWPREKELFLYAATLSEAYTERCPIDEIDFFGLWDGKKPAASSHPELLTRTDTVIDVLTPKGNNADSVIWTRPINTKIGSRENLVRSRSWLQECLDSHDKCLKPTLEVMPQRIVQVSVDPSSGRRVARICMNEDPAHYVALSYCWGGNQPYKTTRASIRERLVELDWDRLPKTLKDAIDVTTALGFQYIWIDCFCIIQDDEDDFAIQMAEVPSIYARAIITLTAARASTASEGFLHDISLDASRSLAVRLPLKCPDGRVGDAYLTSVVRVPDPIDYRAWTMQETYLATRLLYFGTRQLRWQCAQSVMARGCNDGWKRGHNPEDSQLQISLSASGVEESAKYKIRLGVSREELYDHALSHWEDIIPIYTRRRMAHAGDRSWAASGLAEAFTKLTQDEYLAGHWKKSLPYSLMWHISYGTTVGGPEYAHQTPQLGLRLEQYLGPSWSWTSVLGCASFLYARSIRKTMQLVLVDVAVTLVAHKARYGAVKHGSITVRGRMRNATYRGIFCGSSHQVWLMKPSIDGPDRHLVITKAFPDALETEFQSPRQVNAGAIQVHLLELGRCAVNGKRGPAGLILQEIPQSSDSKNRTFRRLGAFHINEKALKPRDGRPVTEEWVSKAQSELHWFEGCNLDVITIV